jgi:UDP-glucose 6-dehydrogenase
MLADDRCRLRAISRLGTALARSDISVVMVPTPSNDDGSFALDHILEVVRTVGEQCESLADPHTVVIMSTVSPRSVGGPIRSMLERAAGRPLDDHLGLAYVPEFHAIGSTIRDIRNPDRLLAGAAHARAAGIAADLFGSLTDARVPMRYLSAVEVVRDSPVAGATMWGSLDQLTDECDVLVLPNDDSEMAGKLSAALAVSDDLVVIDPWGTLARARSS